MVRRGTLVLLNIFESHDLVNSSRVDRNTPPSCLRYLVGFALGDSFVSTMCLFLSLLAIHKLYWLYMSSSIPTVSLALNMT